MRWTVPTCVFLSMVSKSELKFIRSLKIKKYRTGEKCFLVEGEKNVLELLSSDFHVVKLLVSEQFLEKHRNALGSWEYSMVSSKVLSEVSTLVTNDQVLAVAQMKAFSHSDIDERRLIIGLDGINDPGNLGTIIRTMDWFGFTQLICSEDTVDFYNPKVISATMGSFTRVKVIQTDLTQFLRAFSGRKIGAEMKGKPLQELAVHPPMALIMGSESHGLRPEVQALLDERITIPRVGGAESLNVGIATGIICHHLATASASL